MTTTDTAPPIDREELVARAEAMIPTLRDRAPQAVRDRQIPQATVEDFNATGILRVCQPERFGGLGLGVETCAEAAFQTGRGCGATGWMTGQWSLHNWMVGWFSEQAQEDYWTNGPITYSSTASAIREFRREKVAGGVKLNALIAFSSGSDHAEWLIVHGPEETYLVDQFEVVDDWFTHGLQGTGSKSVRMVDVFVPEHRYFENRLFATGPFPGSEMYGDVDPFYNIANAPGIIMPNMLASPVVGMGQGVVDQFSERALKRKDRAANKPAFECESNQLRLAESAIEVDTARMLIRDALAQLREAGAGRKPLSLEDRARIRRNQAYTTRVVSRAVARLVESGDAGALYETEFGGGLQQLARDVRGGDLQWAISWDQFAIQYSRVHWGLEPHTFLI
jgi:3-hydroxy-9,10-secoandrosta-1,3,5(10)-triene-9,17-dione monooxygenase